MADLRPKEGGLGPTKSSKEVVNYKHCEACKMCGHFSASGTCELVAGCYYNRDYGKYFKPDPTKWDRRPSSGGRDSDDGGYYVF